ncbi:ATP-binding cassette domain-containing protein [Collinsella sp. AGMB00827]|uniref:ATP-binding cassette domain-containing protein n=1 Tax=Collinsella ureilytica TaxID=2869515 RepID=A0ABS7MKQ7_9ACTN|nr:ATP-binding cassette domain-containing protein [Collinsella urealyticum]MBY4797893.1 ATP-binding cassette domain-containing protein [Collinsella urealyticum]
MTVSVLGVTKQMGGVKVLTDVSVTLADAQVNGFSGINGSGKTMLMRVIAGLVRPTSGKVMIDGKELGRQIAFPPSIGILIENPAFLPMRTGFENLDILASIQAVAHVPSHIKELLISVGLDPEDRRRFSKYSLGMKQRLGIAAAIMGEPDVIILDEPFNALDTEGIHMVKNIIRREAQRGACVILSCHDQQLMLDLADDIHVLHEGHLVSRVLR